VELHPLARQFASVADAYERGRPEYGPAVIGATAAELGIRPGDRVLDLAAGTGKLTRALVAYGFDVVAVQRIAVHGDTGGDCVLRRIVRAPGDDFTMADPLRIPSAMRDRAQAIIDITDRACHEHLDDEYGQIARQLVARLARKRPSPLARGYAGIWAAGVVYAIGQINFLFDPTQTPHLTAKQLAERLGVVQTTMANKAGLINRTLDIGIFEPDLTREAMLVQHPMAWIVEVDGLLIDARTLPPELQDEARRRGLIPDLDRLRAAA
jgi:hypothetical protein